MSIPSQPNIHLVNTPEYREGYANSVQVRVSVWDFLLIFGRVQPQSASEVEVQNFQGIYLSPQQAKSAADPGRAAADLGFMVTRLGEEAGAQIAIAEAVDGELAVVERTIPGIPAPSITLASWRHDRVRLLRRPLLTGGCGSSLGDAV